MFLANPKRLGEHVDMYAKVSVQHAQKCCTSYDPAQPSTFRDGNQQSHAEQSLPQPSSFQGGDPQFRAEHSEAGEGEEEVESDEGNDIAHGSQEWGDGDLDAMSALSETEQEHDEGGSLSGIDSGGGGGTSQRYSMSSLSMTEQEQDEGGSIDNGGGNGGGTSERYFYNWRQEEILWRMAPHFRKNGQYKWKKIRQHLGTDFPADRTAAHLNDLHKRLVKADDYNRRHPNGPQMKFGIARKPDDEEF